ncbi:MAG: hypothetical protein CVT86_08265 [Alphaproteobacteria bacterium HGW-Alphaproteobacteria-8]|jgi:hypothetical protein|nr:MAG: hypothetical protein CVT86_08265 [Alphaproteobacteria bacterium HGW-Alphaproteobacteria-8]
MTKIAFIAALFLAATPLAAQETTRAAFLGIHYLDTSLGERTAVEADRVRLMERMLVQQLSDAGKFAFIDTAPVAAAVARYDNTAHCNGCDTDFARGLGADVAITGEIQKTSNLILSMSIFVRDAETGALVGGGSADMRGNTDDSWSRALRYIVKNRMLTQ